MYNFDNVSALGENSSRFVDLSKYGNNGACTGATCPTFTTAGRFGGACSFDGINDMWVSDNYNITDFSRTISVEAWIYPLGQSSNQGYIVSKYYGSDGQRSWILFMDTSNNIQFNAYDNTSNGNAAGPYGPLSLNTWHHVVAVYNSTTIMIYSDGLLRASNPWSSIPGTGIRIQIGNNPGSGTNPFNGTID